MLNLNSLLFGNNKDKQQKLVNAQSLVQAIIDDCMLVENVYFHFNFNECEVYPSRTKIKIESITVQSLHETQTIKPLVELYTYITKIIKPNHTQLVYSAVQETFRSDSGEVIKFYPYVVE